VGIGEASPTKKLDINGKLRVRGDTIIGSTNPANQFNIASNGGVRVNLDLNSDGSESFGIRKNGNTSPLLFEVTEGGNVDASGNATFDGDLTLSGNSKLSTGNAFDITGSSGINMIIDNDGNNSNTTAFRVQAGTSPSKIFRVQKDGDAKVYNNLTVDGLSGSGTGIAEVDNNGEFQLTSTSVSDVITEVKDGNGLTGGGASGSVTLDVVAENGLKDFNDKVELGGTLTKPTTIDQGGKNMTYDLTGSGDFRVRDNGNSAFFVEDNSNVGIGNESPDYQLDVSGAIGVNDYIYHNGDPNTHIYFTPNRIRFYAGSSNSSWIDIQDGDGLVVNENGLQRNFRVEGGNDENLLFADGSSDQVGIGTDNPGDLLHIAPSSSSTQEGIFIEDASAPAYGARFMFDDASNNVIIGSRKAGTDIDAITIERNNGNVNIGASTPNYKLDVDGDINLTGAIRSSGSSGSSNDVLTSTGTGVAWKDISSAGIGDDWGSQDVKSDGTLNGDGDGTNLSVDWSAANDLDGSGNVTLEDLQAGDDLNGNHYDGSSQETFSLQNSIDVDKIESANNDGTLDIGTGNNVTSGGSGSAANIAIGNNNTLSATSSSGWKVHVGIGHQADVSTSRAGFAIGYVVEASGPYSMAIGVGDNPTEATQRGAHAFGLDARATAINAHAIGGKFVNSTSNSAKVGYGNDNMLVNGNNDEITMTTNGNQAVRVKSNGQVDMNSDKIVNVKDPTNAQDAATKSYVDNNVNDDQNLSDVLNQGNSAGSKNIDMNNQEIIDASNVGIGVTNPARRLSIQSNSGGEGMELIMPNPSIWLQDNTDTDKAWSIYNQGSIDGLAFRSENDDGSGRNTRMFLEHSSGDVGIGTTNPNSKLSVGASGDPKYKVFAEHNSSTDGTSVIKAVQKGDPGLGDDSRAIVANINNAASGGNGYYRGVQANAVATDDQNSGRAIGVEGRGGNADVNYGIKGMVKGGDGGAGVFGWDNTNSSSFGDPTVGTADNSYAGYFAGKVNIEGQLNMEDNIAMNGNWVSRNGSNNGVYLKANDMGFNTDNISTNGTGHYVFSESGKVRLAMRSSTSNDGMRFEYANSSSTFKVQSASNDGGFGGENFMHIENNTGNSNKEHQLKLKDNTQTNMVEFGKFVISSSGNKEINVGFQPSSVKFIATPPFDQTSFTETSGGSGDQNDNYAGTMIGFAENGKDGTTEEQFVMFSGGSGNSINNVRYGGNSGDCIAVSYGNKNGGELGDIAADIKSWDNDGFTLDVRQYSSMNNVSGLTVMYEAHR